MDTKNRYKIMFNTFAQIALPSLTIGAQIATSLRYPQFGLIINMVAQPFWLYSTWKAYKKAGQIRTLISVIIFTLITAFGIINYWFL